MYSIPNPAGRLIMVRLVSPLTDDDVADTIHRVRMLVLAQPERVVMFGDLRQLAVMQPAWAESFSTLFTRDNPRVERSAFIVAHKLGSFTLQLERMVREANNPARKVFSSVPDVTAFLDPALTTDERAALREFIAASK